jgi:hypothetical protein
MHLPGVRDTKDGSQHNSPWQNSSSSTAPCLQPGWLGLSTHPMACTCTVNASLAGGMAEAAPPPAVLLPPGPEAPLVDDVRASRAIL